MNHTEVLQDLVWKDQWNGRTNKRGGKEISFILAMFGLLFCNDQSAKKKGDAFNFVRSNQQRGGLKAAWTQFRCISAVKFRYIFEIRRLGGVG